MNKSRERNPNATPQQGGGRNPVSGNIDGSKSNTPTDLPDGEIDAWLKFVSNINVVTAPVLTQLLSSNAEDSHQSNGSGTKKYSVVDGVSGAEIFQVLDISGRTGNPNIRGLTLTLPSGKSVLHCGYQYTGTFTNLELSSASGAPWGVLNNEGRGIIGSYFVCCCACFCCPLLKDSIRYPGTGEKILVVDTYIYSWISISRPSGCSGSTIGGIDLKGLERTMTHNQNENVKVKLEEWASPYEKLLVIGLAVGYMDHHMARYRGLGMVRIGVQTAV